MAFDILIKNGTIYDGEEKEPFEADIGIRGGNIEAVGDLSEVKARVVIDAASKYVAPGFIDIQNHSDSYLTLLEIPSADSMIIQGITTIAVGHCGTSLGPLPNAEAIKSIQKWRSLEGANINWLGFDEYLDALRSHSLGINVASLVGHATMRRGILGDQIRPATKEEIKIMCRILEKSLKVGATGLSLGLVYAHEVDSSQEELLALTKLVADAGKMLSVHLRSEGRHIVQAVDEVLGLAAKTRVRLKISHMKIRGQDNWYLLQETLSRIDKAYQKGLDVFFDVYPYTTSWTVLYTYLPKWAYEGGRTAILKNLKSEDSRKKIMSYLRGEERNLGRIIVASSETTPAFNGKTISQIAKNQEVSVEEALLNVIVGANTQVIGFDHNLSEDVQETFMKHPLSVIATDGAAYNFVYQPEQGFVHPRCFGTMPKFLGLVREKKLMSMSEAIKKITSRPAQKLGLAKRGIIKVGNFADVVVFDPKTIDSRATYENPYQQAEGIDYVLINGQIAVLNGEMIHHNQGIGRVLTV